MKTRKYLCALLAFVTLAAVGCNKPEGSATVYESGQTQPAETEATYEEVKTFYGESAEVGGMTVTVTKVEDPKITMDNSGKMAVFFSVKIDNGTEDAVPANYLNNFTLTVDGEYLEAADCFTIPVMKKLYDTYGEEALQTDIAAGESVSGYLAAEVDPDFEELALHYLPKTSDRASRVTVELTRDDMTAAE